MKDAPDTVTIPLAPCDMTATLLAIAPTPELVIFEKIAGVAAQVVPVAQKGAGVATMTGPTVGVGGLPIVTVTVDGFDATPFGPVTVYVKVSTPVCAAVGV
jgi:hypothetical protein